MEPIVNNTVGAVVLAAGKGTRLGVTDLPKVMLPIGGRPIVSYGVDALTAAGFTPDRLNLVVGFKKELIEDYFKGRATCVFQENQLGTAHAAYTGIKALPDFVTTVLILGGDDCAFYLPDTLANFVTDHLESGAAISLLTTVVSNPALLGRVVRDQDGSLLGVYEKEQIAPHQTSIHEVSTGTYCVDRAWYQMAFPSIPKVDGLNEIGLNNALALARQSGQKIMAFKLTNPNEWFGINTPDELAAANKRKT